ncbi:uncharacterized protein LOC111988403 [Quercus suber]|uniref:uncharacterized protein LOC111988403 n=1 Tax=Quercus suber TaxID=58331 RepID=UPI0032DFD748
MRSKKRNATASPSHPPLSDVDDRSLTITKEVNDAIDELYNGHPTQALNLVKSILSRHPNSALAHGALSFIHLKISHLATITDKYRPEMLKHIKRSVDSSKRAVQLCQDSLSFWSFHASPLMALAKKDTNAGFEAVIEACDTGLAIQHPTVIDYSFEIYKDNNPESWLTQSQIELHTKKLRLLKLESKYFIDTTFLAIIKNEIQELQGRKEEIEEKAIALRKNLKKVLNDETVATQVKDYWNDKMSMELKKDLWRIRIKSLKQHFDKKKSPEAVAVVMQAMEYVKAAKNWKFWTCCCCNERFFDVKWNAEHLKSVHLGTLSDELRSAEPKIVSDSIHDSVKSRKWAPVDVVAAVKMMEDLSRKEGGDEVFLKQKWPYCIDREREAIINKIRALLDQFLSIGCFVQSHLQALMDLIMEILKKRIPEQLLKEHWMNRTLLSACFLDISELNRVFEFLDDLGNICGLHGLCKSLVKDEVRGEPCEKLVFNEDFSFVEFDKRMLSGQLVVPNDGAAVTSSAVDEIELNDDEHKDAIVDWLLKGGTNIGEQLKQWKNLIETCKSQGKEFFKIYEAEFHRMQNTCEKKIEYLRDIKECQNLESIYVEEDKRREEFGNEPLSYESLLSKRERQIKNTNDENSESDIIWKTLAGHNDDNEINLEIKRLIDEMAHHGDNEIKLEIRRLIDEMTAKLYKFDAIIRTTTIAMKQTAQKIDTVTACDYRSILVPLLKSFMRVRLEDLANKDAKDTYKAVEEASLSEFGLDDKKKTDKGGGNARHGQRKSKDKKKKKDKRRPKELKLKLSKATSINSPEKNAEETLDMEELELKVETKPKDSVNEMGISEVAKLGKRGSSLVE